MGHRTQQVAARKSAGPSRSPRRQRKPHPVVAQLATKRRELGLSLDEAAALIGIGKSTLTDTESGYSDPTLPTIEAMALAYGFTFGLTWVGLRQCQDCSEHKALIDFPRDRTQPDGMSVDCAACCTRKARTRSPRRVTPLRKSSHSLTGPAKQAAERDRRVAIYSAHRDTGLDSKQVVAKMTADGFQVAPRTRQKYERAYQDAQAAKDVAA